MGGMCSVNNLKSCPTIDRSSRYGVANLKKKAYQAIPFAHLTCDVFERVDSRGKIDYKLKCHIPAIFKK